MTQVPVETQGRETPDAASQAKPEAGGVSVTGETSPGTEQELSLSYARPLSWLSLLVILVTSLGLSFFISNIFHTNTAAVNIASEPIESFVITPIPYVNASISVFFQSGLLYHLTV